MKKQRKVSVTVMERKTVSQAQIYVRDAVNRAAQQAGMKDFNSAVKTLLPVIKRNPDIPLLFEKIREYEINKLKSQGGSAKTSAAISAIFTVPIIYIVTAIDPLKAMAMCENSLANYVDNPAMLNALAAASEKADAPWGVVSALKTLCNLHPGNEARMRRLADAMQQNNQALDALKIHQELLKSSANSSASLAQQAELRSAMALASIERGNFNDRRNAHANTADAEDAMIAQLLEGTIHDSTQAQVLINRFTAELKKNDSIDMRRKLADAYMVAEQYEEALQEYRNVADKIGVMDPVLDKHIEKAYVAQLKQNIAILKANPEAYENAEAQIADLEKECLAYRWRHTVKRAEQFSGDMQLQFDLGVLQFENNMFAEAVETFTKVSDNPQKRRASLVYLGRCAIATNEPEKAIAYLDDALKEMFRMDIQKREALYYLGNAHEMNGNSEQALECYRKISSNMSNYRDIKDRIAALAGTEENN